MKLKGPENNYKIKNFENVTEATYLGVTIGGRYSNIYEKENEKLLDKADKKVNTVIAEVQKSADKVMVGKAIWKLMSMPSIMFGRAIIPTYKKHIDALQKKENRIWRYLLGIGGYSTVDALRGEMGASLVKSRVIETTLQYIRDTMSGNFNKVKEMMLDIINSKIGRWYRRADQYRSELNIEWEELFSMTKMELKRRVKEYDTNLWIESITGKPTLMYYAEGKTRIGYEHCYRNNANSMFLERARINSLKLEEAIGRGNNFYNTTCKLCNQEEENLVHFLVNCPVLEGVRRYNLLDRNIADSKQRAVKLLFRQSKHQEVGLMIKNLWNRRKAILRFKKEEKLRISNRKEEIGMCRSNPEPIRRHYPTLRIMSTKDPTQGKSTDKLNRSDPGPESNNLVYRDRRVQNSPSCEG